MTECRRGNTSFLLMAAPVLLWACLAVVMAPYTSAQESPARDAPTREAPARMLRAGEQILLLVYDRDLEIPLEGVVVEEATTGATAVTNVDGRATLRLPVTTPRAVLTFHLPGYEPVRTMVTGFDAETEVPMVILGILEAEELVIVADRIGRTDDRAGVSVVIERDFIKSSAMIGVMEDVMSSVKLLPGVSYSGGFGTFLSVRGGEPDGLTHVMDGLVVKYPYHWGGGVSVFNPHVIDSVKLSAGIFPVRYGQATSGLMEVTSIDPVNGYRWEFAQSTSTLEGYAQIPFGDTVGLFAGSRLTNYDLVFAMTGQFLEEQGVTFSRVPYIYAGYLRWVGKPSPQLEWFVNTMVGTDGIGVAALNPEVDTDQEILNSFDFRWRNYDILSGAGASRLIGDRLRLEGRAGYEYVSNAVDARFTERGTRTYSDTFVNEIQTNPDFVAYRPYVSAGDDFSIDQPNSFYNETTLHHSQFRLDADYLLADDDTLQAGFGGFVSFNRYTLDLSFWETYTDVDTGEAESRIRTVDQAAPSNLGLITFGYINYGLNFRPGLLSADIGLRVDHGILFGDGFHVGTEVALGPRILGRWTPEVSRPFTEMTATVGTGIFTKVPSDAALLNDDLEIENGTLTAPKSLMALLGWEGRFDGGFRVKIEGYYKYLYDRFYINFRDEAGPGGSVETIPQVYTDGVGHAAGFDVIMDRRTSRRVDGMIAYSFIHGRYINPRGDAEDGGAQDPRDRWYYPSFHRYHTFNALVNVKPRDWLTITTTVTFATGAPEPAYGSKEVVPVFFADARDNYDAGGGAQPGLNVAETYSRREYYSDDNRQGWVLPVDLRISFHSYGRNRKVYREFYLGAEDVLSPIMSRISPTSDAVRTDKYTGEDTSAAEQDVSFPIISIGLRLSY